MSEEHGDVELSPLSAADVPEEAGHEPEALELQPLPGRATDRQSVSVSVPNETVAAAAAAPAATASASGHQNGGGDNDDDDDAEAAAARGRESTVSHMLKPLSSAMDLLRPSKEIAMADLATWTEEKRSRMVDEMTVEQLGLFIRKSGAEGLHLPDASLTFRNIHYQRDGVTVVNAVSGYLRPGLMVAVMGEGSSWLFDVLAARVPPGEFSGEVLLNGAAYDAELKKTVGLITKEDLHLPTLSVRETLLFSAQLRAPRADMTPEVAEIVNRVRVEVVMKMLGLRHVGDSIVGDATLRGVSGGEKRRVSIATELVVGHSIILADLPTNGLDSRSAQSLATTMRRICSVGNSAMFSLVQPSPDLLNTFDMVLLLSRGTSVYFGPPALAEAYFNRLGFRRPPRKSVPDFLDELMRTPQKFYAGIFTKVERRLLEQGDAASAAVAKSLALAEKRNRRAVSAKATRAEKAKLAKAAKAAALEAARAAESGRIDAADDEEEVGGASSAAAALDESKNAGANLNENEGAGDNDDGGDDDNDDDDDDDEGDGEDVRASARPSDRDDLTSAVRDAQMMADRESVVSRAAHEDAWTTLTRGYKNSNEYAELGRVLWTELEPKYAVKAAPGEADTAKGAQGFQMPFLSEVLDLFIRQWKVWIRNKEVTVGGIFRSIFIGVLIGLLFFRLGGSQADARARMGLLFFSLIMFVMPSMQLLSPIIEQRAVYYEQRASGYFRPFSYFAAFLATLIPFSALEAIIFEIIMYPMTGLSGPFFGEKFWYLYLMIFGANIASKSFIIMVASISRNNLVAQAIAPVFMMLFMTFNGFLIQADNIPPYFIWIYYMSYMTYGIRGIAVNEFEGLSFYCSDKEAQLNQCQFTTGESVLKFYAMDVANPSDKWWLLLAMYGFFVLFAILASITMIRSNFRGEETVLDDEQRAKEELFIPADLRAPDANARQSATMASNRLSSGAADMLKKRAAVVEFSSLTYAVQVPAPKAMQGGAKPAATATAAAKPSGVVPAATAASANDASEEAEEDVEVGKPTGAPQAAASDEPSGGLLGLFRRKPPVQMVERKLLNEVFGYAVPGKMIALMGASGAGKSTLLDVLAGIKTGGSTAGSLLFNGAPRSRNTAKLSGYVEQFDSHEETATVREAIEFSARLRLPASYTDAEREHRVLSAMEQLDLTAIADVRIGNAAVGGISPDQRKKVTIAVELVTLPSILFLDEPTTGLSSTAAYEVMRTTRRLADSPTSVICTIHQPSQEIVSMFDWLLLLQPGGRVVYFGPVEEMADYFAALGAPVCPPTKNVADYALEVIANPPTGVDLPDAFIASEKGQDALARLKEGVAKTLFSDPASEFVKDEVDAKDDAAADAESGAVHNEQAPFLVQFEVLLKRFALAARRNVPFFWARVGSYIFMSVVMGLLYRDLGNSSSDMYSRSGLLFFVATFTIFSGQAVVPMVIDARATYFREVVTSRMYSPLPYFLARLVSDIPIAFFSSVVFSVILYFTVGLGQTAGQFFAFWFMVFITVMLGIHAAMMWAHLSPNAEMAGMGITLSSVLFMLLSGFLISKDSITITPLLLLYYVNTMRYQLFFYLANESVGLTYPCGMNNAETCTAADFFASFGVDAGSRFDYFGAVIGWMLLMIILSFIAMKNVNWVKR